MSTGTCSIHSWNDGCEIDEGTPGMGQSVDQRLVPDNVEEDDSTSRLRPTTGRRTGLRSQRVRPMAGDENGHPW